jgi:hypothetical protein
MLGDSGQADTPTLQVDEEQDVVFVANRFNDRPLVSMSEMSEIHPDVVQTEALYKIPTAPDARGDICGIGMSRFHWRPAVIASSQMDFGKPSVRLSLFPLWLFLSRFFLFPRDWTEWFRPVSAAA